MTDLSGMNETELLRDIARSCRIMAEVAQKLAHPPMMINLDHLSPEQPQDLIKKMESPRLDGERQPAKE